MTQTTRTIREVLQDHPTLDMNGLAPFKRGEPSPIDPENEGNIKGFEAAVAWLSLVERTTTPRPTFDSYRYKHAVESWTADNEGNRTYVAPGVFLAAAYHLGFMVQETEHGSCSAYLNISKRSLKQFNSRRFE